jgi:SprT protein
MLKTVLECQAAARVRLESLCDEHGIQMPKITYNVKGTDAGCAYYEHNWIDINMLLFRENFEDCLANTLVHELCHVWQHQLGLGGSAHGREWKGLMRRLGADPVPCHNLNVDAVASRTGFFTYRCLCNGGNMVSLEMHRRIQEFPDRYCCEKCEQAYVYMG